ncbi:MAG: hypothetical protein H6Q91_866, partial [Deltaproteobacteria bacterium]|nr:hypothetical protein [Deltaproteobacteria bacterium]
RGGFDGFTIAARFAAAVLFLALAFVVGQRLVDAAMHAVMRRGVAGAVSTSLLIALLAPRRKGTVLEVTWVRTRGTHLAECVPELLDQSTSRTVPFLLTGRLRRGGRRGGGGVRAARGG